MGSSRLAIVMPPAMPRAVRVVQTDVAEGAASNHGP
jgi:hypothetical protein